MAEMGRPRQFDVDAALDKAVQVFQGKGYEATTVEDLTAAMGVNRPSLYAAFGNKEALFHRVLDRYRDRYAREAQQIFAGSPNTRQALEAFLDWAAEWHLHRNQGLGCLIVNSSPECRRDHPQICEHIQTLHVQNEEMLFQQLQQGVGVDLSEDVDVRGLAQFFNGVLQGMAVLARAQQDPEAIRNLIRYAMCAWPDPPQEQHQHKKGSP